MHAQRIKGRLSELASQDVHLSFIIKGSPDPDALASCFALSEYYIHLGGEATTYHDAPLSHVCNKTMVNILGIDIKDLDEGISGKYVIVDTPDPVVPGFDFHDCVLHIDHHKKVAETENGHITVIEQDAGACSTIVTKIMAELGFFAGDHQNIRNITTALAYGIKSDTDNLDNASPKDWEAMKLLSQYYNKSLLKQIANTRINPQTAEVLKKALLVEKQEQNWLYACVGFLQESYRDSIALVADELIKRSGIECVLVYAIIVKETELVVSASIRTDNSGIDLDDFAKKFSADSGGRLYKGGFQIQLGFWSGCPDRKLLEQFITTTIEDKIKQILGTSGRSNG